MSTDPTIIYTLTDEAPLLATHAFLPIVRTFTTPAGMRVEESDISVAARILGNFPEYLTPEQRVPDTLAELGKKTLEPDANIIKLPNISASVPQLVAAIKELQAKGYKIPDYPGDPKTDEEKAIKARYAKCIGSAVNPVLREGNSDRRAPRAVKEYARKNPHSMAEWAQASRTHVSHMRSGDFYHGEKSMTLDRARDVKMELITKSGKTLVLKPKVALLEGEIIDSMFMSRKALCEFYEREIEDAHKYRRDVLAARQGHDDEGVAPDRVRPLRADLLQGSVREARRAVREPRRERQQRHGRPVQQDRHPARIAARRDHARPPRLPGAPAGTRDGRFGQGHHQLPFAQRRHRRRIDAGDDPRRRQDVRRRRPAEGSQGGHAGEHVRAHLPGDHQLLQVARRIRPAHDGHRAERRPDGAAGGGIRLARQDLRDPGGRRGQHHRPGHRRGAADAERRGGRHLAHVPGQGRGDPRLGQARGHALPQLGHAGGVLARPIPPARERADQEGRRPT